MKEKRISIIGTGNIGTSIADGLVKSTLFSAKNITLTRRKIHLLEDMKGKGFIIEKDNRKAVKNSEIVILAVEPHQSDGVLTEISPDLHPEKHVLISIVTGLNIAQILKLIGKDIQWLGQCQILLSLCRNQ